MNARGAERREVRPNLALTVIAAAQLMVVLDATIVNIALPFIRTALHFSPTGLSWVLNAYTLVFGGLLLLGGRTGDLFGRRRMFIIGVSMFAAASLAGGFAQDKGFLLAMRALQGVGGAIASPTALSLVATTFEQGRPATGPSGVYAAVSGAGAAIGLILGGVLTDLAVVAVGAVRQRADRACSRDRGAVRDPCRAARREGGTRRTWRAHLHRGHGGVGLRLHPRRDRRLARSRRRSSSFAAAAVLLTSFVTIESRSARPLMPLRLFRNRTRVGSYLVMLILGAAVFAMFYFLTQYVQTGAWLLTARRPASRFLPISAVIVTMAQIASRVVHRSRRADR